MAARDVGVGRGHGRAGPAEPHRDPAPQVGGRGRGADRAGRSGRAATGRGGRSEGPERQPLLGRVVDADERVGGGLRVGRVGAAHAARPVDDEDDVDRALRRGPARAVARGRDDEPGRALVDPDHAPEAERRVGGARDHDRVAVVADGRVARREAGRAGAGEVRRDAADCGPARSAGRTPAAHRARCTAWRGSTMSTPIRHL